MKINEFVEKATTRGWMPIAANDQNEKIKKELEIKPYLSIKQKKELVDDIVESTVIYDNGLYKFNGIDQLVVCSMKAISAYSNLELGDDIEDDYDALCSTGLMAKILRTFEEEFQSVLSLLQMQCDYILMDNSVTAQINVVLNAVTNAINKISDNVVDSLKYIKQEDISGIIELVNKLK